jgi:predicted O-methyltransferase YrrM
VDVERFLRELPQLFDDFPHSALPRDGRFAEILAAVPGLAEPNNLALLNLAAACLAPGESYVEVGTYRGTSLIAALAGNDTGDFVALDNWSLGDGGPAQLEHNLARFGLSGRAALLEGDAFETLRSGALGGRRAGVYYYDNGHTYEQQLDGLRLIEPYLASPALVVVDDTDWERVEAAVADYLAAQPRAAELLRIGGKASGAPQWWEGMLLLGWDLARPDR